MIKKNDNIRKYGFTLVELLATIVILAIILVIAVPKMLNVINETKKSTFATSVKSIAKRAEEAHIENESFGVSNEITCENIATLSKEDYKLCEITFEKDEARVTVVGSGKFDGLSVVYASKTNAVVQTGEPERLYTFDDVYALIDGMTQKMESMEDEIQSLKNQNGNTGGGNNESGSGTSSEIIENLQNQINEHDNKINSNTNKINTNTSNISNNSTTISNMVNKDNSNNVFLKNYPVGSIYVSTESANPGTKFGGTWVAFGSGRTLVGVDSSQIEFASVGLTGGAKTHTLTINEMPSHAHSLYANTFTWGVTSGLAAPVYAGALAYSGYPTNNSLVTDQFQYSLTKYSGDSQPHNNLQPYITVYMWKRTA